MPTPNWLQEQREREAKQYKQDQLGRDVEELTNKNHMASEMATIPLDGIAVMSNSGIVARVTAFADYEAELAILEEQAGTGMVWDCSIPAQDKAAREWRRDLVSMRTGVETARKESTRILDVVKSAFMDSQRAVMARIAPLEAMADLQIKSEEKRKADIKAEQERVEQARKDHILELISDIRGHLDLSRLRSSDEVQKSIVSLTLVTCPIEQYQEFTGQALTAKADTLELLNTQLEIAIEREAQAAEAKRVHEENDRLRAEQAETARLQAIKDAEAAAKQAEADRIIQADRERVAAENAEALRVANARIAEQEEREREQQDKIEEQAAQLAKADRERQAESDHKAIDAINTVNTFADRVAREHEASAILQAKSDPDLDCPMAALSQIIALCPKAKVTPAKAEAIFGQIKQIAQLAFVESGAK